MWLSNDGWHSMGWFGWLMMVIFWGIVIYAVVWGFRSHDNQTPADHALSVLEKRYVLGEIDRDEFEERGLVLTADRKTLR